jgi:hypothetical protein
LLFLLCCLLLLFAPAIGYSAERTYKITETELAQLEQNLMRQEEALLKALDWQETQGQELAALKGQTSGLGRVEAIEETGGELKGQLEFGLGLNQQSQSILARIREKNGKPPQGG